MPFLVSDNNQPPSEARKASVVNKNNSTFKPGAGDEFHVDALVNVNVRVNSNSN
jgi:hypothetical protein